MSVIAFGLGKGLKEPCPPYRQAYFFGAELNAVSADGWNCLPSVWDAVSTYNLSTITPSHEVLVALLTVDSAVGGSYNFKFQWFRNRDNKLLYEFSTSGSTPAGGWRYAYSYIGYVPWELAENGEYRVEATVSGAEYRSFSQNFTIAGIPVVEPVPVLPGIEFMGGLQETLWSIGDYFGSVYNEISTWAWPFYLAALPFYLISNLFYSLAGYWAYFATWVAAVTVKSGEFLTADLIPRLIIPLVEGVLNTVNWLLTIGGAVTSILEDWWLSTQVTVKGLIASATEALPGLISSVGDFFTLVLPNLIDFTWLESWWTARVVDIGNLISTAFTLRESLWSGWQEVRTSVLEFLANPLDWLWDKFTDWFLGPEE